jgi:hypothetical protein
LATFLFAFRFTVNSRTPLSARRGCHEVGIAFTRGRARLARHVDKWPNRLLATVARVRATSLQGYAILRAVFHNHRVGAIVFALPSSVELMLLTGRRHKSTRHSQPESDVLHGAHQAIGCRPAGMLA